MNKTIISMLTNLVKEFFPRRKMGRPRILSDEENAIVLFQHWQGNSVRSISANLGFKVSPSTVGSTVNRLLMAVDFESEYRSILRLYDQVIGLDLTAMSTDTSTVRVSARTPLAGLSGKNGWKLSVKINALVDKNGIPVTILTDKGAGSDFGALPTILAATPPEYIQPGAAFYADRGYDSAANRQIVEQYGMTPVIARRRKRGKTGERKAPVFLTENSPRWTVEAFFCHIKKAGGVAHLRSRSDHQNFQLVLFSAIMLIALKITKSNVLRQA